MKKRMFLSTVLMTLVLLLAVTTATFAWYQATAGQVSLKEQTPTGTLSVENNAVDAGNIQVVVTWTTDPLPSNVNYTDQSGKSFYYNGVVDEDHKVEVANPVVTSTVAFSLALEGDELDKKAAAGTYTITFTATGEVKIGNSAAEAQAVTTEGSTATHTFTIGADGTITVGSTGTVHFGFIGKDEVQNGDGGTIKASSVA